MANSKGEWTNRVVVVTGADSGIGAATARRLHACGAGVVLVDVRESVKARADELGERAGYVVVDVASADGWADVASACAARGRVDVLVSNAAHHIGGPLVDLAPADWDRQIGVNLTGAYLGLRALLPMLQQTAGRVVIVSSVHALLGLPGHPAYAAAKGALTALTRQVAVDYAPVRVNCVLPGPILTPMWDGVTEADRAKSIASTLLKRFGEPDEVAAAIEFLASDAASFITGTTLVVDGGQTITRDSA
jgi:NAD(P)-dependent dehydrogenase (short-subunit alcohol dehydrogenase family)